jgi:rubrerythrin
MDKWLRQFEIEKGQNPAVPTALFGNFAVGSGKTLHPNRQRIFTALAESFKVAEGTRSDAVGLLDSMKATIESELAEQKYDTALEVAREAGERGAMRCFTWGKKVTAIQRSLINRYKKQGEELRKAGDDFYVCDACGFIFLGSEPPEICPACKAPSFRFNKIR